MAKDLIASAPGYLVAVRTTNVTHVYGQEVYGDVALERIDPTTGISLWS